ncbi:hypothetical protein ACWIGI_19375 [Nocardia sp. NPDC055321]
MREFVELVLGVCAAALVVFFGYLVWQQLEGGYEASRAGDPDPYFTDTTCANSFFADGDSSYEIDIRPNLTLKRCVDLLGETETKQVIFVNHLPDAATVCVGRDLVCSPAHPQFRLLVQPGNRVVMDLPTPTVRKRGYDWAVNRAYPIVILARGFTAETVISCRLAW